MARCHTLMAHAWMVRTFIKHCPEVEDFPELLQIARTIFDVIRALETRADDPAGYMHMLRKKIGKLRSSAEQFRHDAPLASGHTNFQQAVISIDGCVSELETILRECTAPAGGQSTASPDAIDDRPSIEPGASVVEDQAE